MAMDLDSFRAWRRARQVAEPARIIPRFEWTATVPAEYRSLYKYLEHRYAAMVVLSFDQIETLLGFPLPAPATSEPDWWATGAVPQAHASAWTGAGRTAIPNLLARTVTFERQL